MIHARLEIISTPPAKPVSVNTSITMPSPLNLSHRTTMGSHYRTIISMYRRPPPPTQDNRNESTMPKSSPVNQGKKHSQHSSTTSAQSFSDIHPSTYQQQHQEANMHCGILCSSQKSSLSLIATLNVSDGIFLTVTAAHNGTIDSNHVKLQSDTT